MKDKSCFEKRYELAEQVFCACESVCVYVRTCLLPWEEEKNSERKKSIIGN